MWAKAGRWWGASRTVEALPIATDVMVDIDELVTREVDTDQGTFDMFAKLQYGLGSRILLGEKGDTAEFPDETAGVTHDGEW